MKSSKNHGCGPGLAASGRHVSKCKLTNRPTVGQGACLTFTTLGIRDIIKKMTKDFSSSFCAPTPSKRHHHQTTTTKNHPASYRVRVLYQVPGITYQVKYKSRQVKTSGNKGTKYPPQSLSILHSHYLSWF